VNPDATDVYGHPYQDAQCCLSGSYLCDRLRDDPDWHQSKWNLSWCSNPWDSNINGYICSGGEGCSSGGWGGGGGGVCDIEPGEFCPAECPICFVNYY